MVHVYKGILLSYKKGCIWVGPNEVDEPRAYYIEWISHKDKSCVYQHMDMESRKMVWTNLFAGQQWRRRHREQTRRPWGRERPGWIERAAWRQIHTMCKRESPCCAPRQPRGVGWAGRWGRRKREGTHVHLCLIHADYGRNQHNM